MTSVRKTGDWAVARRLLAGGPLKLKAAVGTALRQEATDAHSGQRPTDHQHPCAGEIMSPRGIHGTHPLYQFSSPSMV